MAADMKGFTLLLVPVGILVHIVYLASIFDIYFTSPLVHGMEPFKSTLKPPAKRLVLFVADGLRADKFYEMNEEGATRAPYLRYIIENKGSWGVSHTRVPTESRPGHVALVAGFYEDVSAVAKGWKENPVEFDSAFNESRYTWSWGSPDILPMFSKGATGDHVFTSMYPAGMEDFADKDAAKLDSWVFDEVESFFARAKSDEALAQKLSEGQIIFFLHLLGIDTNGHAHRPTSDEYLKNIAFVDQGIKKIVKVIEDYYSNDGKTAYIMTADHGMTNWGSHGAGHAHETLTPLVAWGAGIRGPILNTGDGVAHDEESSNWKLSHLKRTDVNQADIAPLMTSIIGVPFPLNSVGIVPVDYFNNTALFTAENLLTNARQILVQYQVKEEYRRKTSLIFRPFKSLTGSKQIGMVRDIKALLHLAEYEKASGISKDLIKLSLEGLNYYQNYDRIFLNTVVTLGFLGWILYIVLWIIQTHTNILQEASKSSVIPRKLLLQDKNVDTISIALGVLGAIILVYQSAPFMYYAYCFMPILFWNYIVRKLHIIISIFNYIARNRVIKKLSFTLLFGLISVEILVLSFFQREVLCIGLLCFSLWIFSTKLTSDCPMSALAWMFTSGTLAVFPMLPVVGRDPNYYLVTLAGLFTVVAFLCVLVLCCKMSEDFRQELQRSSGVLLYQFIAICFAVYNVNSTSLSLKQKKGLPLLNQVSSWVILFSSFMAPLFSSKNLVIRMTSIILGLTSSYLLMSTAYEGLFLLSLSLLMSTWLVCEHKLSGGTLKNLLEIHIGSELDVKPNPTFKILTKGLNGPLLRSLTLEDLRYSYFFIFFIITAFFGTGNIASINSFDPSSVYCFLTVFSPFLMGALLLCKVFIPFVIVTSAFDAVHIILQVPVHSLFLVVLVLTDIMGLHFFYFVKDYGSWLEIGTSISHYVIMMTFIIFLFLIFGLTRLFTGTSISLMSNKKKHIM